MSITEAGYWLGLVFIGAMEIFRWFLGDKLSDKTGDKRWYFDTSNIISTDGAFQLGAYLAPTAMLAIYILFQYRFFQGCTWAVFCNDTGIGLRMRAVAAIITFRLKYYWNGTGANISGMA